MPPPPPPPQRKQKDGNNQINMTKYLKSKNIILTNPWKCIYKTKREWAIEKFIYTFLNMKKATPVEWQYHVIYSLSTKAKGFVHSFIHSFFQLGQRCTYVGKLFEGFKWC